MSKITVPFSLEMVQGARRDSTHTAVKVNTLVESTLASLFMMGAH